jgi:OmpA-OmpF porin, OOP family
MKGEKPGLIALVVLFEIVSCLATAQNLVPNPGFENYKNLPCSWNIDTASFRDYVENWYIPAATSTDIHSTIVSKECWANPLAGDSVENRRCRPGYIAPHDGKIMAGLFTSVPTHPWHEYLQVRLKQPLIPGQHYCISMWVAPAGGSSLASNNIGMLLTKNAIRGDSMIIAHPQYNCSEIIKDTKNWTFLSGSFIATEADEYLTIGNFFPDNETELIPLNPNSCNNGAYFYIDDVAVILCPV